MDSQTFVLMFMILSGPDRSDWVYSLVAWAYSTGA